MTKKMMVNLYFDETKDNQGWYAEYTIPDGPSIDDSMKIWHPDMPRRRNAVKKAKKIVQRYCREKKWKCVIED